MRIMDKRLEENRGYRLGLYEKSMPNTLSWPEKLAAGKAAGFDFIEISIDETDEKLARLDMTAQERAQLRGWMEAADLRAETMCLSGHRKYPLGSEDETVRARGFEIMHKAILLACDLGIRVIQIAGYDEYYNPSNENTCRRFEEGLRYSVSLAAQYGVLLAFETMETPFMNTVAKAAAWVEKIDSPYLRIYPDSGNITNAAVEAGQDVLCDIEAGRGLIAAFHLKETVPGKFREIPFGTGHVDFTRIIEKAYAMGVRRYMAEFWYVGQPDWRETLCHAQQFLRGHFTKVLG